MLNSFIKGHLGTQYSSLINVFRTGLDLAMWKTWDETVGNGRKSPREQEFVYCIFKYGLDQFRVGLQAMLSPTPIKVTVGGVFCHQTAWVTSSAIGNRRVEIGDLLFVVMFEEHGQTWNNALLLQAKKGTMPTSLPVGDDQYVLYNSWPPFNFVTGLLRKQSRHVTGAPHAGAKYALLNLVSSSAYMRPNLYASHAIDPPTFRYLATELAQTVLGGSGRQFVDKSSVTGIDWDQVVWDLLSTTFEKATLTRLGYPSRTAERTSIGFAVGDFDTNLVTQLSLGRVETTHPYELPPPPFADEGRSFEDADGVSVIIVNLRLSETKP